MFNDIGNFFSSLFGGGQKPQPKPQPQNNNSMFSPQAQAIFNNPSSRSALNSGQQIGYTGGPSNFQSTTFSPQSNVLGAKTFNAGGGGGGGSGFTPNFGQITNDTRNQYQDQQNQVNSLFGQQASLLQNQLGDLGNQKNSLLDTIGTNYGGVIQQAKDTLSQNLGALNQAKGDVTTGYENQKADQGRLLNDTQRQNRELARALGDSSSSFYENLQSGASGKAAQNVTNIGQQEQSQLDTIAHDIVSQNTDAGTKIQNLTEAENNAKTDIINKYQAAYNYINTKLSGNNQDRINAVQSLGHQMQSTLDNLAQTMASYKASAGGVSNPIANYTAQAKNLAAIQNIAQPIQDQQLLQQAISDLQSNPSDYQNIVGQLKLYDAQNGTQLSQQIANLQPQQTGTTGGFFGIGGTPTYSIPGGQGPLTLPQNQTNPYLQQILQNLGG